MTFANLGKRMNFRIESIELAGADGRPRSLTNQKAAVEVLDALDAREAVSLYAELVGGTLVGECSAIHVHAASATLKIGKRVVSIQALSDLD